MDQDDGIHFQARNRPTSVSSSASTHSFADTITRVSTVASALKKFFNRDDNRQNSVPGTSGGAIPYSASSVSLSRRDGQHHGGSMRITDQVIEEVDEQLTITSVKPPDVRPTIQSIFPVQVASSVTSSGQPQSAPIDIPNRVTEPPYRRTQSELTHFGDVSIFPPGGIDEFLSSSAPTAPGIPLIPISSFNTTGQTDKMKSQESLNSISKTEHPNLDDTQNMTFNQEEDEFEKLRIQREQEKLNRAKQKINRTVSIRPTVTTETQVAPPLDTDLLIDQLIETEKTQKQQEFTELNKTE